jgi:hypothetical protein
MSQPNLQLTELDGALGVQPDGEPLLAFVGVSSIGPFNTPSSFARTKDVTANFGAGPLVEAACFYISVYKKPALLVRTAQTVAATNGTINISGVTGTSVVSITAATLANGNYDLYLKIVTGGTRGAAGITFQWSLDDGRTLEPLTALGVATSFAFPGAGGISFDFAAGTLLAGDVVRLRTTAPNWNSADLAAAMAALKVSIQSWDVVHVVGPLDGTTAAALNTAFASMTEKAWIGSFRVPNAAESEATYLAAAVTAFSSAATTYGALCFGAAKVTSGLSFRQYRQPAAYAVAARIASLSEEEDAAELDFGALQGVDIRDANGNIDEHDESANPGADDARFVTLRTWDGEGTNVYINNPRLFSSPGSDFEFFQHRRVMNLAKKALRIYMQRRLSKPIIVNAKTGFILESQAVEIEAGANAVLRAELLGKPKASAGAFGPFEFIKLSRTDNLLSTKTLTGQAGIVPLAYPKAILIDIGFRNPALQVLTA